jgi:cysteinyl-tRNA synthetase
VYFRGVDVVARAGLDRDEALRLAREYADDPDDPARDDPFDVPIWRRSDASDNAVPAWPSPWGWGRPGWHAECAAMSHAVLGTVDVLAGGADLAFPHHAYQAALVEAATGVAPFARVRVGIGTVHLDGAKMAKSTGNLVLVSDLLRDASPAAIRLLILDRPWSQAWNYRAEDLSAAGDRLDRLYAAAGRVSTGDAAVAGDAAADEVRRALLDDLDVRRALDVAEESGGDAARLLLRTLALG